jgi:type IX secretion system PorP/SprF family membrane protein
MKKIPLILSLLIGLSAAGQDIHFSQFFEAPLLRNPSLAGIFTGDIRVQAVYRDQWNNVTDAYRTGSINAEYKMPVGRSNDFVTTGLQVLYDRAGTVGWTTNSLLPALNYHKSLSNEKNRYLSLGFMGGWVQHRFDASKATTNSTYDNGGGTGEVFPSTQYSYLDMSVGMSFNSHLNNDPNNNFFIGAAYHHLNKPSNSFYHDPEVRLQPKWVFSGGIKLKVTDYSYFTIQADHTIQGQSMETVAGAMYGYNIGDDPEEPSYAIHGGLFLRWNDALIPVVRLDYGHTSVSISYDANTSTLRSSSYGRGALEVSVAWFGFRNKGEYLLCPRF